LHSSTLNSEYCSSWVKSRPDSYVKRKKKELGFLNGSPGLWLWVCIADRTSTRWMQTVLFCFILSVVSSVWKWQLRGFDKWIERLSVQLHCQCQPQKPGYMRSSSAISSCESRPGEPFSCSLVVEAQKSKKCSASSEQTHTCMPSSCCTDLKMAAKFQVGNLEDGSI